VSKKKIPPQQEFGFSGTPPPIQDSAADAPDTAAALKAPPQQTAKKHLLLSDRPSSFKQLIDRNFLEYASYVICDRAIPKLEDGLKPVQRRILHALHQMDDGRFIKVANVVGHTMQFHPHGDASIADALVNITNKNYLIEGQGNFGNIHTGDRAAASRYIECRLTDLARNELFNKQITKYVPSYDGRNQEPVTLPSKLPLLLMLGAEGIAVGLSTRILSHNFIELIEAQIAILQNTSFKVLPDFIQGGFMDVSDYSNGNGKIKLRALIEETDHNRLLITELPHGMTTESLTSSIEDAIRKKKLPVRAINDFTAESVEIELVLSPGSDQASVLQALYAFTNCETSITARLIVISDGRPAEMNVDDVLKANTQQLLDILKAELELKRDGLLEELHRKTLVQIFVENRIYKEIEKCKTYDMVQKAVREGLEPFKNQLKRSVTTEDIEMLLAIRIKRISLFDINKNKQDIDDIGDELETVKKQLKRLTPYAIKYLKGLLEKYGPQHPRRTVVKSFKGIEVKELTAQELSIKHDTETHYIGHQVAGDVMLECSSLDKLVIVWNDGRYRVIQPPDKFFVDDTMLYCKVVERDKVMTVVYTHDKFTYLKRFTFGGTILNKDYLLGAEGSEVLLFKDDDPQDVFVRYKPAKGQRKHQEHFKAGKMPIKGVRARGNQMTFKKIAYIDTVKGRWWQEGE
jgi:topoisomerase-4 subunit A